MGRALDTGLVVLQLAAPTSSGGPVMVSGDMVTGVVVVESGGGGGDFSETVGVSGLNLGFSVVDLNPLETTNC